MFPPRKRIGSSGAQPIGPSSKSRTGYLDNTIDVDSLFKTRDVPSEPEFKPLSLDDVTGRTDRKHDPDCEFCNWGFGKPSNPKEFPRMALVFATYTGYLKKVTDEQLYLELQKSWQQLFVDPFQKLPASKKAEFRLPLPMTIEKIRAHFEEPHCIFHEVELVHDYADISDVCRFLKKHIGKENETDGKESPDEINLKLYFTAFNMKQRTWSMIDKERRR